MNKKRTNIEGGLFIGIAAGIALLALVVNPKEAGTLSEARRASIQVEVSGVWDYAASFYSLRQGPPLVLYDYVVEFPNAVAVSRCTWPYGQIIVNERRAANQFGYFFNSSIPHEIAHLAMCEIDREAHLLDAHGPRWEGMATNLGMKQWHGS